MAWKDQITFGIVAQGRIAVGIVAIGGTAIGVVAVGGIAVGGVAIGGITLGGLALGAIAIGWKAVGAVQLGVVGAQAALPLVMRAIRPGVVSQKCRSVPRTPERPDGKERRGRMRRACN